MALATTRIQKRWLVAIAGVVLLLVLFWNQKQYLELTATASKAEIRRNREEMRTLRAEMLAMKRSMFRWAVGAGAGATAGATAALGPGVGANTLTPGETFVCAKEDERCNCNAVVVYGKKYLDDGKTETSAPELMGKGCFHKVVFESVLCSSAEMGGDPIFGQEKHCYCFTGM